MTTKPKSSLSSPSPDRFVVAVDVVVLTLMGEDLHTLLIRRDEQPFKGQWMLPGGVVQAKEDLLGAANRVLKEKSGLSDVYLEQLYTYSAPGRDPRDRSISVTHVALVHQDCFKSLASSSHETVLAKVVVPWEGEVGGPIKATTADRDLPLAFDHAEMIGLAVKRMRGKLDYTPVGYQLLPTSFTISQLQRVHEGILGRSLNKDSFRRRMLATGELEPIGESQSEVDHRPAALYRFAASSAI